MDSVGEFRAELTRYADAQPTKAAAASALGITRQDLYRYMVGETTPRPYRMQKLARVIGLAEPNTVPQGTETQKISAQELAQLRDVLLHLVTLVELDLATRRGDERGAAERHDSVDGD